MQPEKFVKSLEFLAIRIRWRLMIWLLDFILQWLHQKVLSNLSVSSKSKNQVAINLPE